MDKTFCIFGDSVTQSAYVKIGWVDLLRQHLETKYPDDFISVFNLGVGGNTTGDVINRFNNEALSRNPTSLIFAVGINDTKANNPPGFTANIEKLIKLTKEYPQDITFVGLVLGDWAGNEPFSQERITIFNHILKTTTGLHGCKFIDLQGKLTPIDFQDGLHPNQDGHRKMFEVIKSYF